MGEAVEEDREGTAGMLAPLSGVHDSVDRGGPLLAGEDASAVEDGSEQPTGSMPPLQRDEGSDAPTFDFDIEGEAGTTRWDTVYRSSGFGILSVTPQTYGGYVSMSDEIAPWREPTFISSPISVITGGGGITLKLAEDPKGDVNKIVSIGRHGPDGFIPMKSVLYPVKAGTVINMGRRGGSFACGAGWRALLHADAKQGDFLANAERFKYEAPYFYVEIDEKEVMRIDEADTWSEVVVPKVPVREKLRRFYRANTGRSLVDKIMLKVGYEPKRDDDDDYY